MQYVVSPAAGAPGDDGLSAYEVAVANGFVGTESEWLASLVGPPGPTGSITELSDVATSYWTFSGPFDDPTYDSGPPSPEAGVNFDIYIDTTSGGIYQKVDGVWVGPYVYGEGELTYEVGSGFPPSPETEPAFSMWVDVSNEADLQFYVPKYQVTPDVGDVLTWDGTSWIADPPVDTGAAELDELDDVVITDVAEFQTLEFNGTSWVNEYASTVTLVQNAEATTLTTGTVVYLFGGTGDHASVKRADNSSDATSSKTVGVVGSDIDASETGPVITRGYINGIDLSTGYAEGDVLWLGESGAFTTTKPSAPDHLVFIGVVVRATNNGIIYVATQNGYELEELHNVLIDDETLADGDVLTWDGDLSLWVNAPSTGGGGSTVLSDFDAPYSYMGVAPVGSLTSDPVWTITRIDTTGPVVTAIAVDVAWDDRLTETYI